MPVNMRSAMPLSEKMTLDEYLAVGKQWGATLGEDECPFEDKVSDWGWYDGRRVALGYSTPAWGMTSRATDCPRRPRLCARAATSVQSMPLHVP